MNLKDLIKNLEEKIEALREEIERLNNYSGKRELELHNKLNSTQKELELVKQISQ